MSACLIYYVSLSIADIILNHNHDREGFTKCFENLVEKDPSSAHSLILLGDAYLRILNPELAIDALERAYKLDPNNGRLRAKIGKLFSLILSL